jgi:PAS domain S-box-containing protein
MPESVMIVEDEGVVALELEQCLRQLGYKVPSVVGTGAEAVARAAEIKPDLVLMDIRLKGKMDGIEAAQEIMNCQSIPVVYLTAHSDDATVRRARETAPFGYVLKPWEEKSLQIAIDLALHKFRADLDIKNERNWYLSILRYTGAPMIVCDAAGVVRFLNASAEQLLGAGARGAVGRRLEQVVNLHESERSTPLTARALRDAWERSAEATVSLLLDTGADELLVDVAAAPIVAEGGEDLGFVIAVRPQAAGQTRARRGSLDDFLQTELIRLLILQEHDGPDVDRFVEGELAAYRRLMRDFLGRDLPDVGGIDWRQSLVRRAVRDAHEQTKAVLLRRAEIVERGRLTAPRLARYLEVLCDRLVSPGEQPPRSEAHVEIEEVSLDLDTAIYCVLIVNEIVQDALSAGARPPVSVRLGLDKSETATLVVSLTAFPAAVMQPPTPVLSALVSELGGTLALASEAPTRWAVTFPLPRK